MQRATIIALVLAAVGCGDVVRAPITVVVDTDRARHLEEQGRLQELRVGVQGDRIELERARADLQQARRRLEDSAVDPAGRAAAAAEVKALEVRLGSAPLSSSSLSREEFELALVASEQRVTASLAAEMGRLLAGQGTAPATQTTTSVPAVRVEDARAIVVSVRQQLAGRGLVIADVPDGQARVDRVEGALRRADPAGAAVAANELVAASAAVVVDRPLVRRKYERLRAAAGSAGRTELNASLTRASNAITAEDVVGANRLLNEVEAALR